MHEGSMVDFVDDCEPLFNNTSPPVIVSNLKHAIEPGTYVSFFQDTFFHYGRVISSYVADESGDVVVKINKFMTAKNILDMYPTTDLPSPVTNRFIDVVELFQTTFFENILSSQITGIIFIMKTSEFESDPYEGSNLFFVVRYKMNNSTIKIFQIRIFYSIIVRSK